MLDAFRLLLPALIPSWRFFDVITASPRIEYALLGTLNDPPTDWQEFRPRPRQVSAYTLFKRLIWNPQWNESLFLVSCAERILQAPTDHSVQEIRMRIQRELIRTAADITATPFLQFRLAAISRENDRLYTEIAYISPVYPL